MSSQRVFKKKFSIIMPIYNSGVFLSKSINSIINQSLDFEENIELILVNDGSKDNSEEIALEFVDKFPKNILFFSQEHKGQSSAKNLALKHVNGEYIGFLDSDDFLSQNALEDVLDFFTLNNEINVVAIPFSYFGRENLDAHLDKSYSNPKLNDSSSYFSSNDYYFCDVSSVDSNMDWGKNKNNSIKSEDFYSIINLESNPRNYLISSNQAFFREDFLFQFRFNESLNYLEEKDFILRVLSFCPQFGFVKTARYYFNKRTDFTAVSDTKIFNDGYFNNIITNFYFNLLNFISSDNNLSFDNIYSLGEHLSDNISTSVIGDNNESLGSKNFSDANENNDSLNFKKEDIHDDFKISEFIQYAIVEDIINFIENYDLGNFDNFQFDSIQNNLTELFRYIDEDVLFKIGDIDLKSKIYLYNLKFHDSVVVLDDDNIILKFDDSQIKDDNLKHQLLNFEIDDINSKFISIDGVEINEDDENILNIFTSFDSYFNPKNYYIELVDESPRKNEIMRGIPINSLLPSKESSSDSDSFDDFSYLETDGSFENCRFLTDYKFYKNKILFKVPINDFKHSKAKFIIKYIGDNFSSNKDSNNDIKTNLIIKDLSIKINDNFQSTDIFMKDNFIYIDPFNFSIIIAIYNTEDYLPETLDSVINQSLDFEENVQLILVNDGSEDNSLDIALEYQKEYPNNIIVLSQENSGQASARNHGLKYVAGKYVNFLDSDDYFSEDTLADVLNFFNLNSDVDIVAIPMFYFGRRVHPHVLNNKFDRTRVIDLIDEPNNPLLSCSSSFFRGSTIKDFRFDTRLENLEDALLISEILLLKRKYGVISTSEYYYRKRFDLSSTTDTKALDSQKYINRLKQFHLNLIYKSLNKYGDVEEFIKYLLVYDLQWLIDLDELELDQLRTQEFWYYLDNVLSFIPENIFFDNVNLAKEKQLFLYYLKTKVFTKESNDKSVILKVNNRKLDDLAEHWFWVDIIEIDDGYLNISGFLNSNFNTDYISIEAIKELDSSNQESYLAKYVKYSSRENIKYLSKTWGYKYTFDLKVPINYKESSKIKLRVNYHYDGDNTNFNPNNISSSFLTISFMKHAQLSEFSNYSVFENVNLSQDEKSSKYADLILKFEDSTFEIVPYTNKGLLKSEFKVFKRLSKQLVKSKDFIYLKFISLRSLYLIIKILKLKRKPIYIFMDRIENADDNGESLFKYSIGINDNIKKYFVVDKSSEDYKRLSKVGNVLANESFKHLLICLLADKIISSHPDIYILDPFYNMTDGKSMSGLVNFKSYFLQHGVTLGNVSKWLHKFDKNLKLIVAVSDRERASFLVEGYNFDEEIIQTIGFPRFDHLTNEKTKKQIVLMPTWRKNVEVNRDVFIKSDYYKRLTEVLNNKEFIEISKELGYEIVFKPHPRLLSFINDTDVKFIDLLKIDDDIKLSEDSYRDLFNSSSLLITDYSSVAFDFAFLKKPIIYYQPDDDYHHGKSYFDFEDDGFGEVISEEGDLIEKIKEILINDCKMDDFYINRVDKFFKYTDSNNCKRVYEWIKGH